MGIREQLKRSPGLFGVQSIQTDLNGFSESNSSCELNDQLCRISDSENDYVGVKLLNYIILAHKPTNLESNPIKTQPQHKSQH